MDNYILDADGKPVKEPDLLQWALWFEKADRTIKWTDLSSIGNCPELHVSTVFLGTDHRFSGEGEPILWETLVFNHPYPDELMQRYSSREAAIEGHEQMVAHVVGRLTVEALEREAKEQAVRDGQERVKQEKAQRVPGRKIDLDDDILKQKSNTHVMTDEAALAHLEWLDMGGCSCHLLGHPPCSSCTHPGNIHNLVCDETAWREKTQEELRLERVKRKFELED